MLVVDREGKKCFFDPADAVLIQESDISASLQLNSANSYNYGNTLPSGSPMGSMVYFKDNYPATLNIGFEDLLNMIRKHEIAMGIDAKLNEREGWT